MDEKKEIEVTTDTTVAPAEPKKVSSIKDKTPAGVTKKSIKVMFEQRMPDEAILPAGATTAVPAHVEIDTISKGTKIRYKVTYLDFNNISRAKIYEWTAPQEIMNVLGYIRYHVAEEKLISEGVEVAHVLCVEYI